jgi:hypothetical protein
MTGWERLQRFLETDARDVGCEEAMAALHVYVDLVRSGADPEKELPGIAAHLRSCGPCNDDFQGLLAAAQEADGAA